MGERVSFRQVGKDRPGKLYKGVIMDAYNRVSQASIPSKFELVLAKPEVSDGFGHRASRFSLSASFAGESPGPGHYAAQHKSNPSLSKKGFLSGFVSSLQRFRPKDFANKVPGPGTYTPTQIRRSSNPTPGFVPAKSSYKRKALDTPAPGSYDPTPLTKARVLTTSFVSKADRLADQTFSDAPPATLYEPKYTMVRSQSQGLTSAFKLPVHARRFQVNLYDPHSQVLEDSHPGPGYYDPEPEVLAGSSFSHTGLDRFGKTAQPKAKRPATSTPGPGAYEVVTISEEKAPISGSAFMSESGRLLHLRRRNPGPAFYHPMPASKKKSFHLNAERKWM